MRLLVEDVLDMKPFEYYPVDHQAQGNPAVHRMTFHFTPTPSEGTHLTLSLNCRARFLPRWGGRILENHIMESTIKPGWSFGRIDDLIAKEALS